MKFVARKTAFEQEIHATLYSFYSKALDARTDQNILKFV